MDSKSPETPSPPEFRDLGQKPPRPEIPPEELEKLKEQAEAEQRSLPDWGKKRLRRIKKAGQVLPGRESHTSGHGTWIRQDIEYRGRDK